MVQEEELCRHAQMRSQVFGKFRGLGRLAGMRDV